MQSAAGRQEQLRLSWNELQPDERGRVEDAFNAGLIEKKAELRDARIVPEIERLRDAFAGLSEEARLFVREIDNPGARRQIVFAVPALQNDTIDLIPEISNHLGRALTDKYILDEIEVLYSALAALSETTLQLLTPEEDVVAQWEGTPRPPGVMSRLERQVSAWQSLMRHTTKGRPNEFTHHYAVAELSRI